MDTKTLVKPMIGQRSIYCRRQFDGCGRLRGAEKGLHIDVWCVIPFETAAIH